MFNIKSLFNKKKYGETWVEREIRLACEKEGTESEYGRACYQSALKAYQSLVEYGHSGMSISFTKSILNRLIDHKPLTPIYDTDDVWSDITDISGLDGEVANYQCTRLSSLFKYVYPDGTVKYKDVDAFYCVDTETGEAYYSGLVSKVVDEMFPITMPYYPSTEKSIVYCTTFLVDPKNGDFDTKAIWHMVKPGNKLVEICRFFKEVDQNWVEIDRGEYYEREILAQKRIDQEKLNAKSED